jgi:hypothetical protein
MFMTPICTDPIEVEDYLKELTFTPANTEFQAPIHKCRSCGYIAVMTQEAPPLIKCCGDPNLKIAGWGKFLHKGDWLIEYIEPLDEGAAAAMPTGLLGVAQGDWDSLA